MMRGPRSVVVGRLENLQRRMRLLSAYGDLIGPLSSEIPGRGSERGISLLRLRWPFKWINQVVFPPIFDAPPQSINLIIIPVRSFTHWPGGRSWCWGKRRVPNRIEPFILIEQQGQSLISPRRRRRTWKCPSLLRIIMELEKNGC